MWPGIKTETGLPEAPSGGQPGFLSFTTAYTSNQPGHLHYSYPSQGKLQPHSVSQDNAVTLSKGDLAVAQLCFPLLLLVTSNTVKKYFYFPLALFFQLSTLCLQAQASQHPVCTPASFQHRPPPQPQPQWFHRLVFLGEMNGKTHAFVCLLRIGLGICTQYLFKSSVLLCKNKWSLNEDSMFLN